MPEASPSRILGQLLVNQSIGSFTQTADWSIQLNNMAYDDKPSKKIAIYTTFPVMHANMIRTGQTVYSPSVQIVTRGTDEEAYDKIKTIQSVLDAINKTSVTIGGTVYVIQSFTTINPPFFFKQEEKGLRRFYAINGHFTHEEIK